MSLLIDLFRRGFGEQRALRRRRHPRAQAALRPHHPRHRRRRDHGHRDGRDRHRASTTTSSATSRRSAPTASSSRSTRTASAPAARLATRRGAGSNLTVEDAEALRAAGARGAGGVGAGRLLRRRDPRQERQPRGQPARTSSAPTSATRPARRTASAAAASSRPTEVAHSALGRRPRRRRQGGHLPRRGPDRQGHHGQRPALPRRRRPRARRASSSASRPTTRCVLPYGTLRRASSASASARTASASASCRGGTEDLRHGDREGDRGARAHRRKVRVQQAQRLRRRHPRPAHLPVPRDHRRHHRARWSSSPSSRCSSAASG